MKIYYIKFIILFSRKLINLYVIYIFFSPKDKTEDKAGRWYGEFSR